MNIIFFSVDRCINQERTENFLRSFFRSINQSINQSIISTKKSVILNFINAGLFPTFDVKEINVTPQYSISGDAKITQIF